MKKILLSIFVFLLIFTLVACAAPTTTEVEPIRVGVYGPLSGPGANWGLAFKRPTEMWADEINAEGGLLVDGVRYPIEVYSEDTRLDAAICKTVAERLVYEYEVRYIMGPAIDLELRTLQPVSEPTKVVNFSGAGDIRLYGSDHPYTVLSIPIVCHFSSFAYEYLIDTAGINNIYILCANDELGQWCAGQDLLAANELGLEVLVADASFEPDTTDFYPIANRVMAANPDLVSLAGTAPECTALFAKSARELGFEGYIVSDIHQDIEVINSIAGEYAEGLLWNAGILPDPTSKMEKFIEDYRAKYGVWNDEAASKIVSAWMIGATIQAAGKAALTDNDAWVAAMPEVAWPNHYVEGNPNIRYVESMGYTMVGIPMSIIEVQNGQDIIVDTLYSY